MMQDAVARHKTSYRQETGKYVPRRFTESTRYRFLLDRRRSYLARIDGVPTDTQRGMVASMAQLEWSALLCESDDSLQSMRESREHRRLLLKVLADFEQTLAPQSDPRPRGRARAGPPQISLDQHLELLRSRREAAT
jgi:hypothetical protein